MIKKRISNWVNEVDPNAFGVQKMIEKDWFRIKYEKLAFLIIVYFLGEVMVENSFLSLIFERVSLKNRGSYVF